MDMPAFYDKQRPVFFAANIALCFFFVVQDLWRARSAWDGALDTNLAFLILLSIAGRARPLWLQWGAGLFTLGLQTFFLVNFSAAA